MTRWNAAGKFVADWFLLAFFYGHRTVQIARWVTFATATVLAIAVKSKLKTTVLGAKGNGFEETPYILEFEIGVAVLVLAISIMVAIAFGVAWARFRWLEISDTLEKATHEFIWCLPIRNFGSDTEVPVYGMAIADKDGLIPAKMAPLPVELSWLYQKGGRPVLTRGVIFKVQVVCIQGSNDLGGGHFVTGVTFYNRDLRLPEVGSFDSEKKDKLWIQVAFGDYDNTKWFSVQNGKNQNDLKIVREDPPFVKPWKDRLRLWLTSRAERLKFHPLIVQVRSKATSLFSYKPTRPRHKPEILKSGERPKS